MKNKRKWDCNFQLLRIAAIFEIIMLCAVGVFTSVDITCKGASTDSVEWEVTLNFSELTGKFDHVVFGEASDARDGSPADIYDKP